MPVTPGRTVPRVLLDRRVPMRDGVELSADVYLPPNGDGPWPAVLLRTPYDNALERSVKTAQHFAEHEYAVVAQDVRGRNDSDGEWEPFVNEGPDGHDTVEWAGSQAWCTGDVGMIGVSYGGFVQWVAAKERPPHLRALVSVAAAGRWLEELPYKFGVLKGFWAMAWLQLTGGRTAQPIEGLFDWERIAATRPYRDADIELGRPSQTWRTWLEHATLDAYWQRVCLDNDFGFIDLPVLHVTGWFDADQWGQLHYWHGMQRDSPARDRQWLISGPWDHFGTVVPQAELGGRQFGPHAVLPMRDLHRRFFDRWLKGSENGQDADARARIFTMGRNEWREIDQWPPADVTETPYYLHSSGHANTLAGDGMLSTTRPAEDEPSDCYAYDPEDATPSHQDVREAVVGGSLLDNRWRIHRQDVLVYTSPPLEREIEITGHPVMVLYASSDCPDTDWHVTLSDVLPNGRSDQLAQGCMRAAQREGRDHSPTPLEPGRVYEFRVELNATSNLWARGHRLRVTVASADFPDSNRNPNTNALPGEDATWRVARNAVHHTPAHPSHLLAPTARSASGPRTAK